MQCTADIANRHDSLIETPAVSPAGYAIPISMAKVGEKGVIVRISGNPEVRKFLSDLGFTIGTTISAVSDLKGSKILNVRGSKVAIDSGMASKIMFCPE